jgi:hypothetical protein
VWRPIPLTPFPMQKGGTEAEGGPVLSFKGEQRQRVVRSYLSRGNRGRGWPGPIFQVLTLGAEPVLSGAEGGQPCRKCETHRGFHIQ